jgi:hypothetical protein
MTVFGFFSCLKVGAHGTVDLGISTDTLFGNDRTAGPRKFYGYFSSSQEINDFHDKRSEAEKKNAK